MTKSNLDEEQWVALFADEAADASRHELCLKYGTSKPAIAFQAKKRDLQKRQTGARDSRFRPPGGWPEHWPYAVHLAGKKTDRPEVLLPSDPAQVVDRTARAFVFEPTDPNATEAGLIALGRAAAEQGRLNDFLALEKARRAARRWCGAPDPDASHASSLDPDRPVLHLRTAQRPPAALPDGSDWSTWLFLGGRGAGKTLAGASWLADQAEALGPTGRLALIGPTLHDVREVMIEGVSGIRALPRWTPDTRPVFESSRRRLIFPGGGIAYAFSAEDPDSLRGPQFSAAWADEFCAWPRNGERGAAETLALVRMGLRLSGPDGLPPRLVVTTTPRPTRSLIALRDEPTCVLTHAGTTENAPNLSPGFLDGLRTLYGGTRREAQELDGKIVDLDGALFTAEMMALARNLSPSPCGGGASPSSATEWGRLGEPDSVTGSSALDTRSLRDSSPPRGEGEGRPYDRVIVALDPTTTATGDACGIVVAASRRRTGDVREAVVLADLSKAGLSPDGWARRAVQAVRDFKATAIVAEVNQGGEMVAQVLRTAGCTLKVTEVRATKGKRVRAEPVAALYEQGRVLHRPVDGRPLDLLEEELMAFGTDAESVGSLDRADALVWAVTHLLIDTPDGDRGPRYRVLSW